MMYQLKSWRSTIGTEATGRWLLIAAAILVGIAILASGSIAKGINGIAGILWFVAAGILVSSLRRAPRPVLGFGIVVAMTLALVLLVKPADVLWAAIGFGVAGAVIASLFPRRALAWGTLVPALWLPCHLLVAGSRAAYQELVDGSTHLRTSPPPTAAVVPLVMVVAALLGAYAVSRLMDARAVRQHRTAAVPDHR